MRIRHHKAKSLKLIFWTKFGLSFLFYPILSLSTRVYLIFLLSLSTTYLVKSQTKKYREADYFSVWWGVWLGGNKICNWEDLKNWPNFFPFFSLPAFFASNFENGSINICLRLFCAAISSYMYYPLFIRSQLSVLGACNLDCLLSYCFLNIGF